MRCFIYLHSSSRISATSPLYPHCPNTTRWSILTTCLTCSPNTQFRDTQTTRTISTFQVLFKYCIDQLFNHMQHGLHPIFWRQVPTIAQPFIWSKSPSIWGKKAIIPLTFGCLFIKFNEPNCR